MKIFHFPNRRTAITCFSATTIAMFFVFIFSKYDLTRLKRLDALSLSYLVLASIIAAVICSTVLWAVLTRIGERPVSKHLEKWIRNRPPRQK